MYSRRMVRRRSADLHQLAMSTLGRLVAESSDRNMVADTEAARVHVRLIGADGSVHLTPAPNGISGVPDRPRVASVPTWQIIITPDPPVPGPTP